MADSGLRDDDYEETADSSDAVCTDQGDFASQKFVGVNGDDSSGDLEKKIYTVRTCFKNN